MEQAQPSPTVNVQRPMDGDFTKWLEQFNEELLYFEHDLRGEYLDQTGDSPKWVKSGQQQLNELGIRYVVGEIRTIANKNTYLSNIEERDRERIYTILVTAINTITDNLFFNHDAYELNVRNFDSVIEKCTNIMEFAIRRPLLAGERRFIKDTSTEHRIYDNRQQQQESGGIMGIFKRGR